MAKPAGPRINPAFDRHPRQATLIGRIVLAYGEIEFSVCRNAGHALDMLAEILNTLYKTRASSARIDFAQSIIAQECKELGLLETLETCVAMVATCTKIRNRYAHCNWADTPGHKKSGLFYADLENSEFETNTEFFHHFRHVTPRILKGQLDYFAYTMEWLQFLNHEIAVKQGRLRGHNWPRPIKLKPPLEHSPVEKHIPPWLSEGQKALFAQHVQAERSGDPRPTPKQRDLEKKRAEKKARHKAHREKSAAGEARAKSRSLGDPPESK